MGKSRLEGKVALITGGARGMGASEAQLFIDEGAKVVISDVLDSVGQETAKRLSPDGSVCTFLHHDVTSEDDWASVVESVIKTYGQLDILVNNAGIFERGSVLDTTLPAFSRTMDINVTGVFLGMQAVAPHMVGRGKGSIINISSVNGQKGAFGQTNYAAAKAGMHGFTKSLALEVARYGVTVNTVSPGYIGTKMVMAIPKEVLDTKIIPQIPMGRLGKPEEVAGLVAYLSSEEAAFVTGANIAINGGQHMF